MYEKREKSEKEEKSAHPLNHDMTIITYSVRDDRAQ